MLKNFTKILFVFVVLAGGFLFAKSASAATYYVDVANGLDTNDGLAATGVGHGPWKTMQKANTSGTDGSTVNVAAGTYVENDGMISALRLTKQFFWVANGTVTVKATGAATRVVYLANGAANSTFTGFIFDGETLRAAVIDGQGGVTGVVFTSSTFKDPTAAGVVVSGSSLSQLTLTNCTITGTAARFSQYNLSGASITGCAFNMTLSNNFAQESGATNFTFTGNTLTINTSSSLFSLVGGTINISNNVFTLSGTPVSLFVTSGSTAGALTFGTNVIVNSSQFSGVGISLASSATWTASITNNSITTNQNNSTNSVIKLSNVSNPTITGNTIDNLSSVGFALIHVVGTGTNLGTVTVSNNILKSRHTNNYIVYIGSETSTVGNNNLDGAVITGNQFYGPRYFNPAATLNGIHSLLVGFNINATVSKNLFYGLSYGVVVKGNGMTYTSGGVFSNILIKNFSQNLYTKGMKNVPFYNNSIYVDPTYTGSGLIMAYENGAGELATGAIIKNNILYGATGKEIISIGATSETGFVSNNNCFWSPDGSVKNIVGATNYKTMASWQIAGYDAVGINMDPIFLSADDLHLQSNSPCINSGADVGLISDYAGVIIPQGPTSDIGAYEYLVPTAPTIGSPSALSTTSLRWVFTDNASTETGFKVYDNTDTLASSSAATNLTYLDETGLSANTQYTGRYVTAYNTAGDSAHSATASSIYTKIQSPTGASWDSIGVNSVTLSASGTLSNLTSGTSGLYFANTTASTNSDWTQTNSWASNSLSENTQYTFQITSRNGDSLANTAVDVGSKYTLADTPTNFSASSNSNSVTLSVDSFPNDTSGQSGYYFSRSGGGNSGWIQTNSWTDTGLSCGHEYTYSVKYRNGDGTETSEVSTTKSTSGCGGRGSPAIRTLPTVPQGGFKMSINGGALTTSNRNVILGFNAGADIKKMAISITGDFTDASQEDYTDSKQWDLCSKLGSLVKNPTCPDGVYKVYAQFYTVYGRSSANAITSSSITLKSGGTVENLQPLINLPALGSFTKYLQYKQTNPDVKRLQIFLNSDPDTKIADTGVGSPGHETNYFGQLTYKAVIKFQEKYAKDILAPWGFKKGTGYVGKATLNKINELITK